MISSESRRHSGPLDESGDLLAPRATDTLERVLWAAAPVVGVSIDHESDTLLVTFVEGVTTRTETVVDGLDVGLQIREPLRERVDLAPVVLTYVVLEGFSGVDRQRGIHPVHEIIGTTAEKALHPLVQLGHDVTEEIPLSSGEVEDLLRAWARRFGPA